eukprot:snap_masked-scaffold_5-processed-gene-19.39-mRNA-1 protein AED:1.00 eAED:1.00 QI:0/0/0/0/1/1/2/0/775
MSCEEIVVVPKPPSPWYKVMFLDSFILGFRKNDLENPTEGEKEEVADKFASEDPSKDSHPIGQKYLDRALKLVPYIDFVTSLTKNDKLGRREPVIVRNGEFRGRFGLVQKKGNGWFHVKLLTNEGEWDSSIDPLSKRGYELSVVPDYDLDYEQLEKNLQDSRRSELEAATRKQKAAADRKEAQSRIISTDSDISTRSGKRKGGSQSSENLGEPHLGWKKLKKQPGSKASKSSLMSSTQYIGKRVKVVYGSYLGLIGLVSGVKPGYLELRITEEDNPDNTEENLVIMKRKTHCELLDTEDIADIEAADEVVEVQKGSWMRKKVALMSEKSLYDEGYAPKLQNQMKMMGKVVYYDPKRDLYTVRIDEHFLYNHAIVMQLSRYPNFEFNPKVKVPIEDLDLWENYRQINQEKIDELQDKESIRWDNMSESEAKERMRFFTKRTDVTPKKTEPKISRHRGRRSGNAKRFNSNSFEISKDNLAYSSGGEGNKPSNGKIMVFGIPMQEPGLRNKRKGYKHRRKVTQLQKSKRARKNFISTYIKTIVEKERKYLPYRPNLNNILSLFDDQEYTNAFGSETIVIGDSEEFLYTEKEKFYPAFCHSAHNAGLNGITLVKQKDFEQKDETSYTRLLYPMLVCEECNTETLPTTKTCITKNCVYYDKVPLVTTCGSQFPYRRILKENFAKSNPYVPSTPEEVEVKEIVIEKGFPVTSFLASSLGYFSAGCEAPIFDSLECEWRSLDLESIGCKLPTPKLEKKEEKPAIVEPSSSLIEPEAKLIAQN